MATPQRSPRPIPLRAVKNELSDEALTQAILSGHPQAARLLYERYGLLVRRLLLRVLGGDQEARDLSQEVFERAFRSLHTLSQGALLRSWLTTITIFTARGHIRRRKRQRWLSFFAPEELPDKPSPQLDDEVQGAIKATYALLEKLPADERIVFALRFMEELELTEVAAACAVSLATAKRRLARAEERFQRLARTDSVLKHWLPEEVRS